MEAIISLLLNNRYATTLSTVIYVQNLVFAFYCERVNHLERSHATCTINSCVEKTAMCCVNIKTRAIKK